MFLDIAQVSLVLILFHMLIPQRTQGSAEKQLKLLSALFFSVNLLLICVREVRQNDFGNAVLSQIAAYETAEESVVDFTRAGERAIKQRVEAEIVEQCEKLLSSVGMTAEKISADVNISSDGSISITKINLYGTNDIRAAEFLQNQLGIETEFGTEYEQRQ